MTITDEVGITAKAGGRLLNLETTRVATYPMTVELHQVDTPPLFAGMQQVWLDGNENGLEYALSVGAGLGSRYMILTLEQNGKKIYEVVNIVEFFTRWVGARHGQLERDGIGDDTRMGFDAAWADAHEFIDPVDEAFATAKALTQDDSYTPGFD